MTLQDLNAAARTREAIIRIAADTVESERPRPRYATVLSIDKVNRTLVVKYPDESVNFTVRCGALLPLATGQVVRIAGLMGDRYVDDIIGAASFDGEVGAGGTTTHVVASQAAMLALAAVRGDVAVRTDINKSFILTQTPATTLANWQELLTPDATAAANNVMSNHLAALDPHAQYLTQTEADALYVGTAAITAAINTHAAAADPHTGYVLEAGGSIILASGTNVLPLTLRGAVGQVANLFDVLDGGGVSRFNITAGGVLNGNGSGLTSLDATNISSGTLASARLPATIAANTTGTAAAWTTARTITLGGDLTGSVSIKGDANATLTATVSPTTGSGNFVRATSPIIGGAPEVVASGAALMKFKASGTTDHGYLEFYVDTDSIATRSGYIGWGGAGSTLLTIANQMNNGAINLVPNGTGTVMVNGNLVWHAGNDGAGSTLDADLLDGQQGAYYLAASSYTAADVLAKLLTVDGAGSNLDADLLDGQQGSYYLAASSYTAADVLTKIKTVDGTGSGLDADLLDGNNSTYFAAQSSLEAVLGDLMYVGLYSAKGTQITNRALASNVVTITTATAHGYSTGAVVGVRVGRLTITNKALTSNVATLTTAAAHGFAVGQKVLVANVDSTFNGTYTITAVTSTTFSYSKVAANVGSTSATGYCALAAFYGAFTITSTTSTTFTYAFTDPNVTSAAASGTTFRMPTPVWTGASTTYRHAMYWIVADTGQLDFIDADLSGRFEFGVDDEVPVANGDWIVAINPSYNPTAPLVDLTLSQVVFQVLPFSAETFVASRIALHAQDINDPHSAAGYLTLSTASPHFAPIEHNHDNDIAQAINVHTIASDPHPQYLIQAEGDVLYAAKIHEHPQYEPVGSVVAHTNLTDPHPQYLVQAEGDERYTLIGHSHNDLYYTKAQIDNAIAAIPPEVYATDAATSRRVFVGDVTPTSPLPGDIWIETPNVALTAPAAASNFNAASPNGTTVNLSWAAWPTVTAISRVRIQRQNGSDWTTIAPTTIFDDQAAPFDTSFTDTGRTENTSYSYRIYATNVIGDGAFAYVTVTTANDAPGAPTGLTVSSQSPTGMRLSWTAPSPFADPAASGSRYEVYRNGVSLGYASGTNTFYDFTGLTENSTYTLGVRARDAGNLVSSIASTTGSTTNAAPPAPQNAQSSGVAHNQATLSWQAGAPVPAQGHPAGGITDFLRYRVYRNDVEIAQTTNTSYTFTGLSGSTTYKLEARTEDSSGSLSADNAAGSFVSVTTPANPDTTPPAAPTISSFQPADAYGRMVVTGSWPSDADTNYGSIVYYPGNGAPALIWNGSVTPGASFSRNFFDNGGVTESAGLTPTVQVQARDANGNWSAVASSSYTLIESPYYVAADSSNSWRNESGGRYNSSGNYRVIQGYFSNPALNSIGLWYYGTKIADQVPNAGRRTVTNVEIFMQRNTGGNGIPEPVSIVLHNETTNPGNAYTGAPTTYNTPTVVATLQWGGGNAWATIPAGWQAELVNGTRRGVAVRDTDGLPYVILDSVSENGYSGLLKFTHYG